jgi:hypothetical protein
LRFLRTFGTFLQTLWNWSLRRRRYYRLTSEGQKVLASQRRGWLAFLEPATVASTVWMLLATGVLACWTPARRAARVDPMVALRYE